MSFEVFYYVDEKGKAPVRDYLYALPENERGKVYAFLKYLSECGYQMRRPFADALGGKTSLYELRPGRHRVLYFFYMREKIILLHAFMKKTDAIPERDIETAMWRKEICEVLQKFNQIDFD